MFRNYIKTAVRSMLRKKAHAFLNIAGLTLGLTCCLLIFQFVAYEYSFDAFNENASAIYRANQTTVRGGGEPSTAPATGWAMGPALTQDAPEVVRFTRVHPEFDNAIVSNPVEPGTVFEEDAVYYADPSFFEMFSYPLVKGEPGRVLAEPGTVAISESAARKYFGAKNPIDQTLDIAGWISGEFRVSAVFEDVPPNSHLRFHILLPMADLLRDGGYMDYSWAGWGWTNFITYIQLRSDAQPSEVERTFADILRRHREEEFRQNDLTAYVDLQPLRDIHLNDEIAGPDQIVVSSYRRVHFFTVIGIVTLLIALVNYVNLATAQAMGRAQEVGVRKAVGGQRRQLVVQFLSESALTILAAFVLSVALAVSLRPVVNNLAGTNLTPTVWASPYFWAAFLATFLLATLLAGLYPAFVLSSFRPAAVLKGKTDSFTSGAWLRRGLVAAQFVACIALLAGTAVVYTQLDYMRSLDSGMELEHVLAVPAPRVLPDDVDRADAVETFTQELRQLSAVRQIATSSALPGQGFTFYTNNVRLATGDGADEIAGVGARIDTSFARLYGLELVAGDGFGPVTLPTPESEPRPIVINETAVKSLGLVSPVEALGRDLFVGDVRSRIVGVLRDFNWTSAHDARDNAFFYLGRDNGHISIRVGANDLPGTIASVETAYRQQFPDDPFRYSFVDEAFAQQYRGDERFATLFTLFTGLAIFIACLGLFGLASFTAARRTKEIGVRKVLGATVPSIALLLVKDFLKLVGLAFLVAAPLAYVGMQRWLEGFAYHIDIGPGVFLLTGFIVVLITVLTVGYQSVGAALANPVRSLRVE